jgi:CheY-like chemotaxis protein
LVVEDEPDTREMLVFMLRLDGHQIDSARNGSEALDLLARQSYDLPARRSYDVILSNLRMPGMDGLELYQRIEERWPHLALRVVFVTAEGPGGLIAPYRGVPIPFLSKPYTLERLRQAIARVLDQNT